VRMVFFLFRPIHENVLYYLRGDDVMKVIKIRFVTRLDKSGFVLSDFEWNYKTVV